MNKQSKFYRLNPIKGKLGKVNHKVVSDIKYDTFRRFNSYNAAKQSLSPGRRAKRRACRTAFFFGRQPQTTGKSYFLSGKNHFLSGKRDFLLGKRDFLSGKRDFLSGKNHFLLGKNPVAGFPMGRNAVREARRFFYRHKTRKKQPVVEPVVFCCPTRIRT